MSKFALIAAVAVLVVVQGFPQSDSEIAEAASQGDWDRVHKLIQQHFELQRSLWEPSGTAGSVRSLKPRPGGHVYGEAEYTFRTSENNNGQKKENKGGHRIVNQDGVVTEYDIQPTF